MKVRVMFLMAILAASGCTEVQYTADGRKEIPLECSGPTKSWGMCLDQAHQLCGTDGYDIISKVGDDSYVSTEQKLINGGTSGTLPPTPRTMVVACRVPPTPLPAP